MHPDELTHLPQYAQAVAKSRRWRDGALPGNFDDLDGCVKHRIDGNSQCRVLARLVELGQGIYLPNHPAIVNAGAATSEIMPLHLPRIAITTGPPTK